MTVDAARVRLLVHPGVVVEAGQGGEGGCHFGVGGGDVEVGGIGFGVAEEGFGDRVAGDPLYQSTGGLSQVMGRVNSSAHGRCLRSRPYRVSKRRAVRGRGGLGLPCLSRRGL